MYICVCIWEGVTCMRMWRSEVDIRYLHPLFSALYAEKGSLPGTQSWPIPPVQLTILFWGSPNSAPRHYDYGSHYVFPAFMSALRMQMEVLTLNTQQVLYPRRHLQPEACDFSCVFFSLWFSHRKHSQWETTIIVVHDTALVTLKGRHSGSHLISFASHWFQLHTANHHLKTGNGKV